MTKELLKETILSFKNLEPGWDGYTAIPVHEDIITRALACVDKFDDLPEAFPTANGCIQFEWETETRYNEMVIDRLGATSFTMPKKPITGGK